MQYIQRNNDNNNLNSNCNIDSNINFLINILKDKKMNIELEVPFQINKLSEAYKNKKIEKQTLVLHLNKLVGLEKTDYYLKLIEDECKDQPPQLSSEFNIDQILSRTDELLKLYNEINQKLLLEQNQIDQFNKLHNNSNQQPQHQQPPITPPPIEQPCNCKSIFDKNIYQFDLLEFLSKSSSSNYRMTNSCSNICTYYIVKKYQELIEYANNRIFFYKSLKPNEKGYYTNCDIGFIEFNLYCNSLIPSIAPLFKKIEDSIRFKIRNKKLTINKDTTNNQSLFGLYWLDQNFITYEINSNTPIEK